MIPDNARTPRITAAAGTELAGASSVGAASRRSMGRVSVPLWLIILSNQLLIVALVVHYTPN